MNYSETNYYFYRTEISFIENDTLILNKQTLLSYSEDTIPLVAFSAEPKTIQKKLSQIARLLLTIELVVIVGFFVTLSRSPDLFSFINLPITLSLILVFIIASAFYYINETKRRLCFYFRNGGPAFTLSYRKNNLQQKQWIDEFNKAIINARLNFDRDNFIKIKKGIDSLEKQNLINKQFAAELHNRVSIIANTNIK